MHDIYGTETYLKYHTEDLTRQAEHERQIQQACKIPTYKGQVYRDSRLLNMKMTLVHTGHNMICEIVIEGEPK